MPPTSGVTLTVSPGEGGRYPVVPFNVVVCPAGTLPLATNAEILRVTARTGDVLTFARAQESSTVRAITAGDQVYQGITEKFIDDLFAAMTPGPQGPIGPAGPAGPQGPVGPAGPSTAVGDATYWTVSAHPGLTAERVMASLANGYVKSTAGEPSTVAVIPVAEGGTGASDLGAARTNLGLGSMAVQQANAVAITGGTLTGLTTFEMTGALRVTGAAVISADAYAFRFIGDGFYLTNLNATQLSGAVPVASLGTGTASATTWLRGDKVWAPLPKDFPAGLIAISFTPCPPGFSRVTGLDFYFLRIGPTPGVTGGTGSHQHGPGSYRVSSHAHGGNVPVNVTGTAAAGSPHAHGYGGTINGTTGTEDGGINTADAGGSFTVPRPAHRHPFAANYAGTTDPESAHTHPVSAAGVAPLTPEEPTVFGVSEPVAHLPFHYDIYLCMRD